jgi:hypothetical protein
VNRHEVNRHGVHRPVEYEEAAEMTASNDPHGVVDWDVCERCQEAGGIGVRLPGGTQCWAHADDQALAPALRQLGEGAPLDARGVSIAAELLVRILAATPRDPKRPDRPLLHEPQFDGASFGDGAQFDGATFGGGAQFWHATFGADADFSGAAFGDDALFFETTFGDNADFNSATFGANASFSHAAFGDHTNFGTATFDWSASFVSATFGHHASFVSATFDDYARFDGATFDANANFSGATFGANAWFNGATFGDGTLFRGTAFGDWIRFGPILVTGELRLQQSIFGQSPDLAISADHLKCQRARFPDGVRLRIRWAEIALDGASFGRPSVLEAAPPFDQPNSKDEAALVEIIQARDQPYRTERPRPVCLAGCDVHNLVLAGCDLRACRFTGAHNLTALRLEGPTVLPSAPRGWQHGRTLPTLRWWGRRETIAEEHDWRQRQSTGASWRGAPPPGPSPYTADWHDPSNPVGPAEVAAVYRGLRKGREDHNDEPGAADFYYGEMEMRRHDRTKPRAERAVLVLYWLVSGYALRASRALAWLAGVLILATVLLAAVGLQPPVMTTGLEAVITGSPPHQALRFEAPSSSTAGRPFAARLGIAALVAVEGAVFRASDQALTYMGRLIQAVLRFVGPILLGLAVLSIRGRVKR